MTKKSPYSIDENLYGRSIETGVLEDPWQEPPDDVYLWTKSAAEAPDDAAYVEIGFEEGVPVSLDGKASIPVSLVKKLNEIAGEHGVGRIDMVEDRLVGIKSREIYEAPAGVTLLAAHEALESLTLSKEQRRLKAAHRAGVRRARLQRPLVLGPPPGPRTPTSSSRSATSPVTCG